MAIGLMLMVESYQLALPMLDATGFDTTRLGSEWSLNPLGVVGGVSLAVAGSAGLFFLWYQIIRSASTLVRSLDSAAPSLIARQAAGLFFLVFWLLFGSFVISNLRHGMVTSGAELNGSPQGMGTGVCSVREPAIRIWTI